MHLIYRPIHQGCYSTHGAILRLCQPTVVRGLDPLNASEPEVIRVSGNVVERLRHKIEYARALGFQVRCEWLDGKEADWCEIAGKRFLFVDEGLTASEQLDQIDQVLKQYKRSKQESSLYRAVA